MRQLTARDFAELQAFELIDGPIGSWRDDWRFAHLITHLRAVAGAFLRGRGRRHKISDFMPQWSHSGEKQTVRQKAANVQAKLEGWLSALTGGRRRG